MQPYTSGMIYAITILASKNVMKKVENITYAEPEHIYTYIYIDTLFIKPNHISKHLHTFFFIFLIIIHHFTIYYIQSEKS